MAISTEEALKIIIKKVKKIAVSKIGLLDSLGHVLAEDIRAKIDVPPFDNSAMDGFAISAKDVNKEAQLKVVGEIKAGSYSSKLVKKGEAISIMTGGVVPDGAAAVVAIENVNINKHNIEIVKPVGKGANIRKRGEDISKSDIVAGKGTIIKPIHTGLAASIGVSELKVYAKPKVSLVITGDELIDADKKLKKGQIYNSNRYLLRGLLKNLGIEHVFDYKARDSLEATINILKKALNKADIVLTTGGISVGKYDFLKSALKKMGAKCYFTKVKQKPGKPFSFFTYGRKLVLSLPGNPVAASLCFELYAKPAILLMSGQTDFLHSEITAAWGQKIKKKAGRKHWVRVNLIKKGKTYIAILSGPQGSGILNSMVADGIAEINERKTVAEKGEPVKVILLDKEYKS